MDYAPVYRSLPESMSLTVQELSLLGKEMIPVYIGFTVSPRKEPSGDLNECNLSPKFSFLSIILSNLGAKYT